MKLARTSGYRRSAVWRPCGVTQHAALQNKSVVCSGSRVTNSTVMKLHESDNRGGIVVKLIQRALAHIYIYISYLQNSGQQTNRAWTSSLDLSSPSRDAPPPIPRPLTLANPPRLRSYLARANCRPRPAEFSDPLYSDALDPTLAPKLSLCAESTPVATLGTRRVHRRCLNGIINICRSRLEVHLLNTLWTPL